MTNKNAETIHCHAFTAFFFFHLSICVRLDNKRITRPASASVDKYTVVTNFQTHCEDEINLEREHRHMPTFTLGLVCISCKFYLLFDFCNDKTRYTQRFAVTRTFASSVKNQFVKASDPTPPMLRFSTQFTYWITEKNSAAWNWTENFIILEFHVLVIVVLAAGWRFQRRKLGDEQCRIHVCFADFKKTQWMLIAQLWLWRSVDRNDTFGSFLTKTNSSTSYS